MKQLKEWDQVEFEKDPTKYTHGVPEITKAIWEELLLGEAIINQKPNGEPVFYLNDDDPNKSKGGVSLEGQLYAAIDRGNVEWIAVPVTKSRFAQATRVWKKLQFGSALEHTNYWWTKYEEAGYPAQFKWPHNGLTTVIIEREKTNEAERVKRLKEKREEEQKLEEWIKGCGDGTGTKEGFILCQKYSQLVEEIKVEFPKRVANNDTGFIERTVRDRLKPDEAKAPEVKQATKEKVLGTEFNPTEVLGKMFKREITEGKQVRVINFRSIKSENYVCYLQFEVEGHPLTRSTRTKDKKQAKAILKAGKKMFNSSEPAQAKPEPVQAKPEPVQAKPEPVQAKPEPKEIMRTIESKPSWLSKINPFARKPEPKPEKVIDLEETRWDEPNEPEPAVLEASVKNINDELAKAREMVKKLETKVEEAKKSEAEQEREVLLARLAELDERISK